MSTVRRLSEAFINVVYKRNNNNDEIPTPTNLTKEEHSPKKLSSIASSVLEGDSTTLLDSSSCEEFEDRRIREIRRSWPHTAQEAEFRYGIQFRGKQLIDHDHNNGVIESNKIDIPQFGRETGYGTHPQPQNNVIENQRQIINWEHLSEDKVAKIERSTVWNGGSGLYDIEQDEKELNRIAALFNNNINKSDKRMSLAMKIGTIKESVLDPRRATTVSVAMKRMRLQPSKFGKLAWALRDMNESYLTPTAIEILMKSCLWATPQEIQDMKVRVKDGHELADPDALLWFLATSVPDIEIRVTALSFRYEFDEIIGEMIRATSLISAASMEMCTSELLKRLMRVTLLVGNNINEAYGGTATWGITITSLSKLNTIKTSDKSLSVLDCIVIYLDQMAPETFEVVDDCTCTPSAAKYSLINETKILKDARKGLDLVRKLKSMEKFYVRASKKLDEIDKEMRHAQESFDKCLDHFCIPRGSMDTDEFFGIISEFFDQLEKAVENHEIRQRKLANPQVVRSGLLNPTFMKQRRETAMSVGSATSFIATKKPSVYNARPSIFGRMKPVKD